MSKVILFLLTALLSSTLFAAELMSFNNIDISVADDYACEEHSTVRLDAASVDDFHRSRMDMQEVAKISKTYLWLECSKLNALQFQGYVEDELVYQAHANKAGEWYLSEGVPKELAQVENNPQPMEDSSDMGVPSSSSAPQEELLEPDATVANKTVDYDSLATLQAKADAGEVQARLDLAKGMLSLEGMPSNFTIEEDLDQGTQLLEQLANQGNTAAMHLLAEAYLKHASSPVNESLVQKLTGIAAQPGESMRNMAAALLTMKAAEQGDEDAVAALDNAGRAGSSASYYALGMMYMLDRQKKMPYRSGFVKQRLKVKGKLSQRGNVDMGLHFMTLAAQAGSSQAQSMLQDMDIAFDSPGQKNGQKDSQNMLATTAGQSQSTAQNLQLQPQASVSGIMLNEMLASRQEASSSSNNEPLNASNTNASSAGVNPATTSGSGAGTIASGGSGGKAATPAGLGRASIRRTRSRSSSAPTDDTIMDSEMGEAVIID